MPKAILAAGLNSDFLEKVMEWNGYLNGASDDKKEPARVKLFLDELGLKTPERPLMDEEVGLINQIINIYESSGKDISSADAAKLTNLITSLNSGGVDSYFGSELGAELIALEIQSTSSTTELIDVRADFELSVASAMQKRQLSDPVKGLGDAAALFHIYKNPADDQEAMKPSGQGDGGEYGSIQASLENPYAKGPAENPNEYGAGPTETPSEYGAGPAEQPSEYFKPEAPPAGPEGI